MNSLYLVIICGTPVTLLFAAWGLVAFVSGSSQQNRLVARGVLDNAERQANSRMVRLDARLRRTEFGRGIAQRITASGVHVRVSTFLALMAAAAVAAVIIVGYLLGLLFGIASIFGVAFLFLSYLRRQEERRRDAFISQLPELARILSNATSAGLAVRTAIGMAADEMSEPARTELRRTSDALTFGQSFGDAMRDLQGRLPSRELSVLISTLVVSARSGGSLTTALRNISGTLEDRKEIRRETKTIMGEVVMTNWAIAVLGIGSLFLINAVQPNAVQNMTHSFLGILILTVAIGLFASGLFIVNKMTKVDI